MEQDGVFPVPEMKGHRLGFVDSYNGKDLKAKKVIDFTKLRKDSSKDRALVLYANTKSGPIVQVVDCSPGENFGLSISFNYEIPSESRHEILTRAASLFRLHAEELLEIILRNAPKR